MRELKISDQDAGQRMDKYLLKYMNQAPKSFLYKMLRKKNIKLNGKKAEGNEHLVSGDVIQLYLADETIDSMKQAVAGPMFSRTGPTKLPYALKPNEIIFQNQDILLVNKKVGELTQKAKPEDVSLNERLLAYCMEQGKATATFKPSVCNRLDRNTSGIVLCGISLKGSQYLSKVLKDRSLHKYYLTIVSGVIDKPMTLKGFLVKDHNQNQVRISKQNSKDSTPIETQYEPLANNGSFTLLRIKLVTGKTHQIRAHLASVGHPIIGDSKYGDANINQEMKKRFRLQNQLLHAYEVTFPDDAIVDDVTFYAEKPQLFQQIESALFS